MADVVLDTDALVDAVASRSFDRPPALVANAHITGLGVARALSAHDVPVIAIDRSADGVAPPSTTVDIAGRVTYPLEDPAGFRADVEALAAEVGHAPVAFGCMDEWVHAFAETRPDGVRLPFAADRIGRVLDKESLYGTAADLGVPFPETYRVRETRTGEGPDDGPPTVSLDTVGDRLDFPLVVKPARKREFEEVMGTNVLEVEDRDELSEIVDRAATNDIRLMVQERVAVTPGEDRSFVSYAPPDDDPVGIVGNPARYPRAYGTSCHVTRVETPAVRQRATSVLARTGYHGISEAEFVHDANRDEYVLLDVNTRPWKWIGLPVQAGVNLPYAGYADAVAEAYEPGEPVDAAWVYLRDYLALLADGGPDRLSRAQWLGLLSDGGVAGLTTAVYDPADPGPAYQLLSTEFSDREYYCAC